MQSQRYHLLHVRTHVLIGNQLAAGIKGAVELTAIGKHQIRVVPLAAEIK
ncbi:MAG TPA: hypothetical protein VGJ51_04705 [Candidatus Angelobacter sp.]